MYAIAYDKSARASSPLEQMIWARGCVATEGAPQSKLGPTRCCAEAEKVATTAAAVAKQVAAVLT
jgi:hypothetical protein